MDVQWILRKVIALCTGVVAIIAFATPGNAVETSSGTFPFAIPWSDATSSVATDVSFLNEMPAGAGGFIVVKNAHFVQSRTKKQIRFLGTNFTTQSDFPTHSDAVIIAAHLAKLGINIVRIHHEDNNYSPLWDKNDPRHITIDPAGIDRLDYLISELKSKGIYVDLNLHVSRKFVPADGFPESVNAIPQEFDKGVDYFDPHMIALDKAFAHDYLTHLNPYTGLRYSDDPCVAFIEINNENSSAANFAWERDGLELLPEPFRGELRDLWNKWLKKRYRSNNALITAWFPVSKDILPTPGPQLSAQTAWHLQDQTGKSTVANDGSSADAGPENITVTIPVASQEAWHTQELLTGINLADGAYYRLSFQAKADTARKLFVDASRDSDDWRNLGLSAAPTIGPDFQTYQFIFQASQTIPDHSRISFGLGGSTGTISLADVQIAGASAGAFNGISSDFSVGTLEIPVPGTFQERTDWNHFLADLDTSYSNSMRAYLRDTLHVHGNIVDTQMEYGDLTSFQREKGSDFADNHAYWQHPSFPGKPWDPGDWTIKNTPMSDSLASGDGGTLFGLAAYRPVDMPYTVTEYNHPAPSEYREEMFPEISTFAAAQDWDAFFEFDYGVYGEGNSNKDGRIQGFFGMTGDPSKEAFLSSAALIFRAQELLPFPVVKTLHLDPSVQYSGKSAETIWRDTLGNVLPDIFSQRLSVVVDNHAEENSVTTVGTASSADTDIKALTESSGSCYLAVGVGAVAAAGYLGNGTVSLGYAQFTFPHFGNNFAALTLCTLDRTAINQSKRLLLTIVGRAENSGMVWNDARTTVERNWGTGPVNAEGIPATIVLTTLAEKHVWALDTTGARTTELAHTYTDSKETFVIGPEYKTVWYEIVN
jgi:hypothetical protein